MGDRIRIINNDGYGAPELKRLYQAFTFKGLIIAVSIHLAFLAAYMLIAYLNEAKSKELENRKERKIIVVDPWKLEPPPPVDDNKLPPPKEIGKTLKDPSQLEPVRKEIAQDVVIKTQDDLNNLPDVPVSGENDSLVAMNNNGKTKIDNNKIENEIRKTDPPPVDIIYKDFEVEKPPQCQNLAQVNSSMQYPIIALEAGIEGRVSIQVLVGQEGSVIKVGKMNGNEVFYDELRSKVVNLEFTPGLQNNRPVKVWVTVPFTFRLQ